jgi:hypothetical protein
LIWELKDLLASNFVSHAVNHILCSCNVVADSLAALRASLSLGGIRVPVANDLASIYE